MFAQGRLALDCAVGQVEAGFGARAGACDIAPLAQGALLLRGRSLRDWTRRRPLCRSRATRISPRMTKKQRAWNRPASISAGPLRRGNGPRGATLSPRKWNRARVYAKRGTLPRLLAAASGPEVGQPYLAPARVRPAHFPSHSGFKQRPSSVQRSSGSRPSIRVASHNFRSARCSAHASGSARSAA